jgi:hypothetical protein
MVIVGLLSVGVALALDKYAERQALKRNRSTEEVPGSHDNSEHGVYTQNWVHPR